MATAFATAFVTAATATTVTATATFAAATTTTASATGEGVEGLLEFVVGSFVGVGDAALEVEFLTSVDLVEVEDDGAVLDFYDEAVETHAFLVHERDDVAGIDGVVGKLAVDGEHLFADFDDALGVVGAIAFLDAEGEVEFVTGVEVGYVLLEGFEGHAEVGDELEGILGGCLLEEFVDAGFVVGVEIVCYGDVTMGHISWNWGI